eukprot:274406_1
MPPPSNDMCPVMAHTTLLVSLSLSAITICLLYLFWKNRETPAFKSRRPIMTLTITICILFAMSLPILAAYNICNKGEIQHTLYFNISSAAIYTYGLWLITYRTLVLFINWKMAISQLVAASSSNSNITSNRWCTIHKYFASKYATYAWCIALLSFIVIEMSVADITIYFHQNNIGPWVIRSCFFVWMFVSLVLVFIARNMRDHFYIMLEMKIYIGYVIIMVTGFIYVGEYLPVWAPQYSPPQLVQIKILLNVIRSGASVLLFMGFPVFRFRFKLHGILVDQNLFEEASIETKSNVYTQSSLTSHSPSSPNDSFLCIKIGCKMYPSLVTFLSKNKKCYDEFRKHLASCLALENLSFFTEAQTFRLRVKLAMQARMDSLPIKTPKTSPTAEDDASEEVDETTHMVMKLDFFYLQKSGGMTFETTGIKENYLKIFDEYVVHSSPYQINVNYKMHDQLYDFKEKLLSEDVDVAAEEYVEIYECAMLEIWWLMETLYLHFQISDTYNDLVKTHFPMYYKYNNEVAVVTK